MKKGAQRQVPIAKITQVHESAGKKETPPICGRRVLRFREYDVSGVRRALHHSSARCLRRDRRERRRPRDRRALSHDTRVQILDMMATPPDKTVPHHDTLEVGCNARLSQRT